MFRDRAVGLGSLCARQSVDPGSRGARRARGLTTLIKRVTGPGGSFCCVHRIVTAGLLVGPAAYSVARGKALLMVALAVPRFGFEPELCLARPILLQALERYEVGDYIGAGVRLRESVRRFLVAAVRWYAVPMLKSAKRDKFARTATLAKALHEAKVLDDWGVASMLEMLDLGNKAAHCKPCCPRALRGAMEYLFMFIDSEPFASMKDRQPAPAPAFDWNADYDIDDCGDDYKAGDWWKPEGWNPGGAV